MADAVLDASAILASLQDEPGKAAVDAVMEGALVCTVNYAEVASKLFADGLSAAQVDAAVGGLPFVIVPTDAELAFDAAALRAPTKHLGLSLGDRFCLALARRSGLPVFTADRNWRALAGSLDIRLIR